MRTVFLDTETLGLNGPPFLIQTCGSSGKINLFHVFDHPPAQSLALINELCAPDVELVAFNAAFDVKMLSKLATVASMVDVWTFNALWDAERIWRSETTFNERLKHLRLVYPGRTTDLMLAAQSLPPLEEQFLNPPTVVLPKFPVAAVPELKEAVSGALKKRPYYSGDKPGIDVANCLSATIANTDNKKDKQRVEAAQRSRDYSVLEKVTLGFDKKGIYTLKTVAKAVGYTGVTSPFDFLDDFGEMPESYCPTYTDRDRYQRLWDYVREHEYDPNFITYARRDVQMLMHIDRHYRQQPGFAALEHDFAMVPVVANLELYGVHVDPGKVASTVQYYRDRVAESASFLKDAGLDNFNSRLQVVRFVNRLLKRYVKADVLDAIDPIDDMQKETLADLLADLKQNGHDESAHVVRRLEHLIRARTFAKRPEFFKNVIGDTLYPQFRIRGTVTDRMTTSKPSVQNMPARATGEEKDDQVTFRSPFTPPDGYSMLVGDADQFEMRLAAAQAGENELIKAFRNGVDPHSLTAAKALGGEIRKSVPSLRTVDDTRLLELLNAKDARVKDFRSLGKVLNFATIYGSTEYGIARQSGKTPDEAQGMLDAFFDAYPAIKSAIDKTHDGLAIMPVNGGVNWGASGLSEPDDVRVPNRLGITRSFNLALRLVQIFARLGDFEFLEDFMPEVAAIRTPIVRYYDGLKSPSSVVASQCRSAAKKLQTYCQRQAFNFLIQSLGAVYIKKLQGTLAERFIPPGVHRACDLDLLPGINVHDEIHLLVRGNAGAVHEETERFTDDVTSELGVPIRFAFEEVTSWADKT